MRIVCIAVVFLVMTTGLFAQYGEESFHSEDPVTGDPASVEVSNPMLEKDEVDFFESEAPVELGAEMMVTSKLKFVNIPLKYKLKKLANMSFSVNLPIIFQKKLEYEFPAEYDAKDGGISDINVGISYFKPEIIKDYKGKASFKVSLPTGDHENTVEYEDIDYAVPLGTGAWGMTAGAGLSGAIADGNFNVNASYKIYTYNEKIFESAWGSRTVTNTKRGNRILLNGTFRRQFNRIKITGVTQFVMIGDGHTKSKTTYDDGTPDWKTDNDIDNNITTLDVGLEGEYKIDKYFLKKVFAKFRLPLMTNTGKSLKDLERPIMISFGFKTQL